MYHGDIRLGDTIDFKFTTRSFTTGAPTTLAGTPVISAYPGNSTTQLTAGITLSVDFDTVTGLHNVRVVATSGNGYATATNYVLVITTGTVGGVSVVGEVIGAFSIEARSALMPTTTSRTLDVSAGGEAGMDWANVGTPSTSVNLSATTVNLTNTVTTYTGNTVQTGDSFARLGAAGAGLTAIPWNAAWDAEVESEVNDALVVHRLDELLNADSDIDGLAPPTVGSVFHEMLTKTAGSFTYDQTTDSLEAIRDRGDAAWITATGFSTHSAADVWASVTRTLTAATNITSTGGTTVPQTGDSFALIGAAGAGLTTLGDVRLANLDATISSRATPAQVNAEVVDALNVDTYAEPGQGTPAATNTIVAKLGYLFKSWRNKTTQTATEYALYNDDAATVDHKAAASDDGATFTRGEVTTGP